MRIHHPAPRDLDGFVHHTHRRPLETNVQSITSGKVAFPPESSKLMYGLVMVPHYQVRHVKLFGD
jgi:hypothetical protein